MPSFTGKFQLTGAPAPREGAGTVSFEADTLQLVEGGRAVLACDLGDIDVFASADYALDLTLYDGQHLTLRQFGKVYDKLVATLLDAWRERTVQCLLLEDLEEVTRFTGSVQRELGATQFTAPAEIRLFKSNVAFLPTSAGAFQWRLADIDSVEFDKDAYATVLRSQDGVVKITKLAKRTDEFRERLEAAAQSVADRSAKVLHDLVPFLPPDRFEQFAAAMREGHSASLVRLNAIDKRASGAISANVVDATLKPYYEELARLAGQSGMFAGFKMIRPEAEEETATGAEPNEADEGDKQDAGSAEQPAADADAPDDAASDAPDEDGEEQPVLHWFMFRIAPPASHEPMIAWEAISRGGRATYVFRERLLTEGADGRAVATPEAAAQLAVDRLSRGLALVNFRREPIYLSDAALENTPRFRRHAIAARHFADLRALRRALVGRAIHTSPDAWKHQLDVLLARK